MKDWDIALVRHFLIEGANRIGNQLAAKAIEEWEYQGPGVWVGIDESALLDHEAVFTAGVEVVEKLGEHISLDYLHDKVELRNGQWLNTQPTSEVTASIRQLKKYLYDLT